MRGGWEETTLADVSADVAYGYTESASDEKIGPRFLRITDIQNGVVDWNTVPYCPISESDHQKYRLHPGDIVVARTGNSTGENYLYRGNEDAVYASYLIRFRVNQSAADPAFVWYNMRTQRWQEFINSSKTGSAQAGANAKVLGLFPLTLPPLPEQRAIASVLGALDDKIELNRRMNATLEAMARALFQSWFVDFDPVRAKLDGRHPEGMDAETAALFPAEFEESTLGRIPSGWTSIPLYDTAKWVNGAAFRSEDFCAAGQGLPVIKIGELKSGISDQTKWSERAAGPDQLIDTGDLLYSWSGSPDTSLEAFLWSGGPGLLNQHIFKVITPTEGQRHFVYYLLQYLRPVLVETARNKQTTGLGHVTVADMKRLLVCWPSNAILAAFDRVVASIFNRAFLNTLESRTLATLRDTLLPKLLSGELQISASSIGSASAKFPSTVTV